MSKVVKNGKLYVNNKNPLEKNNESSLDKQEGFDWDIPNKTSDSVDENDNNDDIRFDFPEGDDDDEEIPSTLF